MSRLRVAVLTAGGDCPGLNAGIARLSAECETRGWSLIGVRDGFAGLRRAATHPERAQLPLLGLDRAEATRRGGTLLGSVRTRLEADRLAEASEGLSRLGVDALVVFGGDGSLRGAAALAARTGAVVVAIPKTIDNDVAVTDSSIGFASAVQHGVSHLDTLDDTARSHGARFLVEVMGRDSGALAAAVAEAACAAGVLVPEHPATLDDVASRLISAPRAICVVAEAAWVPELGERTGRGGVVHRLAAALPGVRQLRTLELGHLLRGGSPTTPDRWLAQRSASRAAAMVAASRSGVVVLRSGAVSDLPFGSELARSRTLSPAELEALGGLVIGAPR